MSVPDVLDGRQKLKRDDAQNRGRQLDEKVQKLGLKVIKKLFFFATDTLGSVLYNFFMAVIYGFS